MSRTSPTGDRAKALVPPKGVVGRADLLRLLALRSPHEGRLECLVLDERGSGFGYTYVPPPPPPPSDDRGAKHDGKKDGHRKPPPDPTLKTPTRRRPLRRVETLRAITHRESRQHEEAPRDVNAPKLPPLDDKALEGLVPRPQLSWTPLVPSTRLIPGLRRQLSAPGSGALDIPRLAKLLARRDPLYRLPRRRSTRWAQQLVVALDFSTRLMPYREDMLELFKRLRQELGEDGVAPRFLRDGPTGRWVDLRDEQAGRCKPSQAWRPPPADTHCLLLTDLGLFCPPEHPGRSAWRAIVAGLVRAQCKPVALIPVGSSHLDLADFPGLNVLRWSPDGSMRPERGRPRSASSQVVASEPSQGQEQTGDAQQRRWADPLHDSHALRVLLGVVAVTPRVDPELLRAVRKLLGPEGRNAGLEGAVWHHPDVIGDTFVQIRSTEAQQHLAAHLGELNEVFRRRLAEAIAHDHAHLRGSSRALELLLIAAHLGPKAIGEESLKWAQDFIDRIRATLRDPSHPNHSEWQRIATEICSARADTEVVEAHHSLLYELFRDLDAAGRASGAVIHPPGWVDPAEVPPIPESPPGQLHLVEDRQTMNVRLVRQPSPTELPLGAPLAVDHRGVRLRLLSTEDEDPGWKPVRAGAEIAATEARGVQIEVQSALERITIQTVQRPRGAQEWARTSDGLVVRSAPLAGMRVEWSPADLRFLTGRSAEAGFLAIPVAQTVTTVALSASVEATFDIDAECGVSADVAFAVGRRTVTQRFRWLEPGEFLMGSPEGEPERGSDEGPQHRVILTEGFWLAETACAQALWEAVMGGNPSHFKGADRPVEGVSWKDVQAFLAKLEALCPGLGATLPTEAQWEYACRAGTVTPFSFGGNITPEQVNYDGNHPYPGGRTGKYREQTVPVRSLPPNAWGLYEMHGNVWEWCRDGRRRYAEGEAVDPVGPEGPPEASFPRVVRGGSWYTRARRVRSASRYAYGPGRAFRNLGFRLSLRSMGQARAAEQPRSARGAGSRRPEGGAPRREGEPSSKPTEGFMKRLLRPLFRTDDPNQSKPEN